LRREVPIFHFSKSRIDPRRAKRFFETLIFISAGCFALHQQPAARPIALLSLGRNRGRTLAKAMEGDRDVRRQKAIKNAQRETRVPHT
jgi:hypothetical protein